MIARLTALERALYDLVSQGWQILEWTDTRAVLKHDDGRTVTVETDGSTREL